MGVLLPADFVWGQAGWAVRPEGGAQDRASANQGAAPGAGGQAEREAGVERGAGDAGFHAVPRGDGVGDRA